MHFHFPKLKTSNINPIFNFYLLYSILNLNPVRFNHLNFEIHSKYCFRYDTPLTFIHIGLIKSNEYEEIKAIFEIKQRSTFLLSLTDIYPIFLKEFLKILKKKRRKHCPSRDILVKNSRTMGPSLSEAFDRSRYKPALPFVGEIKERRRLSRFGSL